MKLVKMLTLVGGSIIAFNSYAYLWPTTNSTSIMTAGVSEPFTTNGKDWDLTTAGKGRERKTIDGSKTKVADIKVFGYKDGDYKFMMPAENGGISQEGTADSEEILPVQIGDGAKIGLGLVSAPYDGTFCVRYSYVTAYRIKQRELSGMELKVLCGTEDGSNNGVSVQVGVGPSTYEDPIDGAGKVYRYALMDFGVIADDMNNVQTLHSLGDVYNYSDALNINPVKFVDVIFRNVKAGQKFGVAGFTTEVENLERSWIMPTFGIGDKIMVQAEDFDEPWINGHVAHTAIAGANNAAKIRRFSEDCNVSIPNLGNETIGKICIRQQTLVNRQNATFEWGNPVGDWNHSYIQNMHKNSDWSAYQGEYKNETGNVVTMEQARDNFGCWLEYTFDVTEDCEMDLTLRTASHLSGAYAPVAQLGSSAYGKSRENGGFSVDGMDEDYLKKYFSSVIVYLDGVPLRTNWDVQPSFAAAGNNADAFKELLQHPEQWSDCRESVNGKLVNPEVLHIYPFYKEPDAWSFREKREIISQLIEDGVASQDVVGKFIRPDYANIPVGSGRHTLKVRSIGGMWYFDEITIEGHALSGNDWGETSGWIDFTRPETLKPTQSVGNVVSNIEFNHKDVRYSTQNGSIDLHESGHSVLRFGEGATFTVSSMLGALTKIVMWGGASELIPSHGIISYDMWTGRTTWTPESDATRAPAMRAPASNGKSVTFSVPEGSNAHVSMMAAYYNGVTTGIEDVAEEVAVDADAPVEYYNLQGIKVAGDNLRPGVYVKRQGNTVQKILVK